MQPHLAVYNEVSVASRKPFPMRLHLSLNGVPVASIALDPARCNDEYYLQCMRRLLAQKSGDALSVIPSPPVYAIEVPASGATILFDRMQNIAAEDSGQHVQSIHFQMFNTQCGQSLFSTN